MFFSMSLKIGLIIFWYLSSLLLATLPRPPFWSLNDVFIKPCWNNLAGSSFISIMPLYTFLNTLELFAVIVSIFSWNFGLWLIFSATSVCFFLTFFALLRMWLKLIFPTRLASLYRLCALSIENWPTASTMTKFLPGRESFFDNIGEAFNLGLFKFFFLLLILLFNLLEAVCLALLL